MIWEFFIYFSRYINKFEKKKMRIEGLDIEISERKK